jgi:hypothetical protein
VKSALGHDAHGHERPLGAGSAVQPRNDGGAGPRRGQRCSACDRERHHLEFEPSEPNASAELPGDLERCIDPTPVSSTRVGSRASAEAETLDVRAIGM